MAVFGWFLGFALYLGIRVWLSTVVGTEARAAGQSRQVMTRTALLELFLALQRELEAQKEHRAFLSVDVVGSTGMKASGPEAAVEYSFSRYQQWAAAIIRECGGEQQSAAGDGIMAVFPDEAAAVRAARRLQEGIGAFNAQWNRLPTPFRIRCGVSAGEVPVHGTELGQIQSPVVDRAALLQKAGQPGEIVVGEEVAAAALGELGTLSAAEGAPGGGRAYRWSAPPAPGNAPAAGETDPNFSRERGGSAGTEP